METVLIVRREDLIVDSLDKSPLSAKELIKLILHFHTAIFLTLDG